MADTSTPARQVTGSRLERDRHGKDWRDLALCQGMDTNTFFPVGASGPVLPGITEAKRVCGLCPVQTACLTWALNHGVDDGIWGGHTETERRALVLRRRRHNLQGAR